MPGCNIRSPSPALELLEPEPKRRKFQLAIPLLVKNVSDEGTQIRMDGTMTPVEQSPAVNGAQFSDACIQQTVDHMDIDTCLSECPCGYLHGPGTSHHLDISAVGLSSNMMRGPD